MTYQAEGIVHKVFDVEQKSDTFKVRSFVVETEDQYPQFLNFQLVNDKCDLAENYTEGDRVKVSFDLRGREWQGKYFTNLNAWKIESASADSASSPAGATAAAPTSNSSASGSAAPKTPPAAAVDFDDDIPF